MKLVVTIKSYFRTEQTVGAKTQDFPEHSVTSLNECVEGAEVQDFASGRCGSLLLVGAGVCFW